MQIKNNYLFIEPEELEGYPKDMLLLEVLLNEGLRIDNIRFE